MSDVRHPSISEGTNFFLTPEEEFAQTAYEILGHYGVMCEDLEAGVGYPVTDRVEISDDDEPAVRALRLRRTLAMPIVQPQYIDAIVGQTVHRDEVSEEYVVLELQHGEVPLDEIDETEPLVDEDFTWSPYVMAVFKTGGENDYELDVLDANTGKALSIEDIFVAMNALRHLGTWLYLEAHEEGLENDGSIGIQSLNHGKVDLSKTQDFDSSEVDLNYSCTTCGQDNGICDHNMPKMN